MDSTARITLSLQLRDRWSLGLGSEACAAQERNDLRVWQLSLMHGFK